ncbi:hypothetical protein FS749_006224 [Ceratobasidium sp. UAMH 11750]|nr:hypothetical protein FS749_006224 [Ceratobasidium sp. UAMH 11750]
MTTIFGSPENPTKPDSDYNNVPILKPALSEDGPPPVIVHHGSIPDDIQQIKTWIDQGHQVPLVLRSITVKELPDLDSQLHLAGSKPRYDWCRETKTATFRMPTKLHECPGEWLADQAPWITSQLRSVAKCGIPLVQSGGSAHVRLPFWGLACPDKQLDLVLDLGLGIDRRIQIPFPRVVLETSYSQSLEDVVEKAWNYLFDSDDHIHAVIICDMDYPVTSAKNFRASLSVWTREETGCISPADDWPLEVLLDVPHEPEPGEAHSPDEESHLQHQEQGAQATHPISFSPSQQQTPEAPLASPVSSSSTAVTGDTTRVNLNHQTHTVEDQKWTIIRRYGPVYVVDEQRDAQTHAEGPQPRPFVLPLKVFDFLRVCPRHQDEKIPNYELQLPLQSLQQDIVTKLARMRAELERPPPKVPTRRKRGPDAQSDPLSSSGSAKTRGRPAGADCPVKRARHE